MLHKSTESLLSPASIVDDYWGFLCRYSSYEKQQARTQIMHRSSKEMYGVCLKVSKTSLQYYLLVFAYCVINRVLIFQQIKSVI